MGDWTGITPETTVRDVLRTHPETRVIFDKYGMMGCGGAIGPPESVSFFAEMHGLTPDDLVAELTGMIDARRIELKPKEARGRSVDVSDPCPCGPEHDEPERHAKSGGCGLHDSTVSENGISTRAAKLLAAPVPRAEGSKCAHGRASRDLAKIFVRTGLLIFLVYGGTAGLIAFLSITSRGVSLPPLLTWPALVQSHAHAQIFGFAAMFVLGVSYHVMPRFMGVPLQNVSAAYASFYLLLAGVIVRTLYQPLAENPAAAMTAVIGSGMEIAGVIAYLSVVLATLREFKRRLPEGREGQPFAHMTYLGAGGVAFFISAVLSFWGAAHMLVTQTNIQPPALNDVWINVSIVGFIGMFILGVGWRTIPHFLGLEHTRPSAAKWALAFLAAGVLEQIISLGWPEEKMLTAGSALLECFGFVIFLLAAPLLGRYPVHRPAAPPLFSAFIRTAFFFGLAGFAGYAAVSVAAASGASVPRPFADAYRHAWTLGWITMLIVGVGYRVLPIFFGKEIARPGLIPVIYASLTAAVSIRIIADVGSARWPDLYAWSPLSGALALLAVFLFAIEVWRITGGADAEPEPDRAREEITENSNVAAVLESHPDLLPVFVRHGFGGLQNPVARKTVARFITVGQAAKKHGLDARQFVADLNRSLTA